MRATREHLIVKFLEEDCQIDNYEIKKIAGDASFRSYYRVSKNGEDDLILMDAPPQHEDIKPFIKIDQILVNNGFLAPKIFIADYKNGLILLEDLGDLSYTIALNNLKEDKLKIKELDLYQKATDVLVDLHSIETPKDISPYDEELLMKEVMLFIDWYLPNIVKKSASEDQIQEFRKLFSELFKKLSKDSKLVLRDYHADNLFVVDDKVGLIDFQDAVLGSPAYDLVSLLEDARRDVGEDTVELMIERYLENSKCDKEQFLTDYKILSLQRNVKIIGIFARLAIRDKKESYLNFLPKMFKYVILRFQDDFFSEFKVLFNNFDLK
jgi:aminoglycoside/choline kinase family phosphotransferase